ncbi:conserved hypothetical protein [Candidatus Ruthia magnifica str. Cm (Calyptogena magnifica)]|uniref:Uncharacterized protein n=1 Tax=Ruthia magnifica subsp. Calyptogena magnifica TaxID=413404 RepID=A1AX41_RUTMC|nr:AAA family ATPase [Candidatus Ruthturnera calyptogenae]ABL02498.1 conserved hypothetical protein [Candidatus Ruthia magnifica str. Cm (Calyptogena magnifica)]
MTNITRFCVIIGVNGFGKTILFNIFSFLKDVLATYVNTVFHKRGSFSKVTSRSSEDNIEFEIKFRTKKELQQIY